MGNGGKLEEQERVCRLRAESWTLADIAEELGVAKSSVSRWVRKVDFVANPRRRARKRGPKKLERTRAEEIERCRREGLQRIGQLSHVFGCCHVRYASTSTFAADCRDDGHADAVTIGTVFPG